jgi:O-antigen/teichoic acid export membrane protein
MNLNKSSLYIFISKVLGTISSFIGIVIFSRILGASPLGTYYPFIALLGILAIPADIGIRSATEKRISEGSGERSFLGTALVLNIIPIIVIILLILFTGDYISQYLGAELVIALAVAVGIQTLGRLGLAILRGELRVGESALAMALRPIGWLVVGYILVKQGYGVHGIVWGYIAGSFAMFAVAWWKVSIRPAWPSLEHAKSLLDYGRYSFISTVGGYFYSWMDVAVLSAFVALGITSTRGAIGAYENAWRVSMLVMLVGSSIAMSLFPQVSRWDAEDATDRIESIIPKALLPGLLVVFPAFTGTLVLAEDMMEILFGSEFTIASLALIVLVSEKIFKSFQVVLGRSLLAIDHPELAAFATVFSVITNLVLNVVLIYYFGIVGAAVATTVALILNTTLHVHFLNRFLDIALPTRRIVWSVFSAAIMGGVLFGVYSLIQLKSIIHLLGMIGFGAAVYGTILLTYEPIRGDIWDIAGPVISKRIQV